MKVFRREFLAGAASAALLPSLGRKAQAEAYPSRPVNLIVGTAPAGTPDIDARLIGQWLQEKLGQPFIVQNKPGAGTNLGTEMVVRSAPDGYTLLLITVANAINVSHASGSGAPCGFGAICYAGGAPAVRRKQ